MSDARNRNRPNVIITGMARSGTSLTTSVLAGQGYHVGEEASEADSANPRGYFEGKRIVDANVALLRAAGFAHHNTWMFEPVSDEIASVLSRMEPAPELREVIESFDAHTPWVWKDVRFCYTLPVWLRVLDPDRTRFIIVRRRPEAILHSIRRHNAKKSGSANLPTITRLMEHHIVSAKAALTRAGVPFLEVRYEDFFAAPEKVADALSCLTGLPIAPIDLNVETSLNHDTLLDRVRTAVVACLDLPGLRTVKSLLKRALTPSHPHSAEVARG